MSKQFRHKDLDGEQLHAWEGELGAVFQSSSRNGDIVTVAVRHEQLRELAEFLAEVLAHEYEPAP